MGACTRVHARGDLCKEWEDLNSENGDGLGSVREKHSLQIRAEKKTKICGNTRGQGVSSGFGLGLPAPPAYLCVGASVPQ